jgi:protein SCO1/2
MRSIVGIFCLLAASGGGNAQFLKQKPDPPLPAALRGVGIDQKLDGQLPLNIEFRDEDGLPVTLGSYFTKRPVILAPVYYECPMLCTEILNGLVRGLKPLSFNPGTQFDVVAFSFNPKEKPDLAATKKANYVRRYGRPATSPGWHFLTGDEASIKALTDAIGFHYRFDASSNQFAHASAVILATPEGRISRYFYGVEYAPRDLKFGLMEASRNRIGSPVDQALLFCFHYDPSTGKYTNTVLRTLRVAALATLVGLGGLLFVLIRRDNRKVNQAG